MAHEVIEISLATTMPQFDDLWKKYHDTREDVQRAMVSREALINLLYDHSQLYDLLEEELKELVHSVHGNQEAESLRKAMRKYYDGGQE